MAFIDTTAISPAVVSQGVTALAQAQATVQKTITPVSSQVTTALQTTLSGSTPNSVSQIANTVTKGVSSLEAAAVSTATSVASSYLQAALASVTSTFSSSVTSLASGISSAFSGAFTNTNNPATSTTTTLISDPIVSNFLQSKTPTSSAFTVSSLNAGVQPVSVTGATAATTTLASSMTSTTLSTVLDRFNLDSASNVVSTISNSSTANQLSGLFTNLSAPTPSAVTSLQVTTPVTTTSTQVVSSTQSQENDLAGFLGQTSSLSQALGGQNLSSYYITNPTTSLVNSVTNTPVVTNGTSVDATTANALTQLAMQAGCTPSITNYTSANQQASTYNTALALAAQAGLQDLVNSLLGCSQASTSTGQQSLVNAFVAAMSSQLGISSTLVAGINNPSVLNTPYVSQSLVTNPTLSASDVSTLNSLLTTIGSSSTQAMCVAGTSSDTYPLYDLSVVSNIQPDVTNALLSDDTITNYLNGTEMTLQPTGTLMYA